MPVSLRRLNTDDAATFCEAVERSRDLHRPWVTPPGTPEDFCSFVTKYDGEQNISYIAVSDADEMVGCINLNEIVRGAFNSAYLGYYGFVPMTGRGLMKQAMMLVIDEAFGPLGLHRLEANIQPDNEASIGLVRSLGFRHEGFSPRYLFIDGQWRDHERYAITHEDWQASPASTK